MDPHQTTVYKEPAPVIDSANPLESMMQRFDVAAEILGLEQGVYEYLKRPVPQYIVSIPWSVQRVNRRLERIMRTAFDAVYKTAEQHKVTMRIGAYILAIDKVARTLKVRGIYA